MTDTEKKKLSDMAKKLRREQDDLIYQAHRLHCSNKQTGQTDGDQCLARMTDIYRLKQGTFAQILNIWAQTSDKSTVEDMFEIDHHIPFWRFIEQAIAAMTETKSEPQDEYQKIIEQMKTWAANNVDALAAIDEFNQLTDKLTESVSYKPLYVYTVLRLDDETATWTQTFTSEASAKAYLQKDYDAAIAKACPEDKRRISRDKTYAFMFYTRLGKPHGVRWFLSQTETNEYSE